jgi:hypothetical protein
VAIALIVFQYQSIGTTSVTAEVYDLRFYIKHGLLQVPRPNCQAGFENEMVALLSALQTKPDLANLFVESERIMVLGICGQNQYLILATPHEAS